MLKEVRSGGGEWFKSPVVKCCFLFFFNISSEKKK